MARVLITGAAGLVGRVLSAGLADQELTLVDRRRAPGVHLADGRLPPRMQRLMAGQDVVVDLAGNPGPDIGWRTALGNNLLSAVLTLRAAQRSGVARVVLASSSRVTHAYEADDPWKRVLGGDRVGLDPLALARVSPHDPIRPDSPYAVAKAAAEAAGRYFFEAHGMSVICIRVGTVTASGMPETVRHRSTLLAHSDLVQLVDRCIDAPSDIGFRIVYGVSNNTWRMWDLEDARDLGYEPQIDAELLSPAP